MSADPESQIPDPSKKIPHGMFDFVAACDDGRGGGGGEWQTAVNPCLLLFYGGDGGNGRFSGNLHTC